MIQVKYLILVTNLLIYSAGNAMALTDHQYTIKSIQRDLNLLGFNIGLIDGKWGQKSQKALERFISEKNLKLLAKPDNTTLEKLNAYISDNQLNSKPARYTDFENLISINIAPYRYPFLDARYGLAPALYLVADFDRDGKDDVVFTGDLKPDHAQLNKNFINTGDFCGGNRCSGYKHGPSFFKGTEDGKFIEVTNSFLDGRQNIANSGPKHIFSYDFNNDGILDVYIADLGLGTHKGYPDSYFLSGPAGWVESSKTHINGSTLELFSHAASIGDIDGDGDMDILVGHTGNKLTCLFNTGNGNFRPQTCGRHRVNSIELVDIDGDNDLDLIHSGAAWGGHTPFGISLNDGFGFFTFHMELPEIENFINPPLIRATDLDGDGDYDLVASRVGHLYGGVGFQIIENIGELRFKSDFITLLEVPKGVKIVSEGNDYNHYVSRLNFNDVDNDKDLDIILLGHSGKFFNTVLINEGKMKFRFDPSLSIEVKRTEILPNDLVEDFDSLLKRFDNDQKRKPQKQQLAKLKKFSTQNNIDLADTKEVSSDLIYLERSGAIIQKLGEVSVDENSVRFPVKISWDILNFNLDVCVETNTGGFSLTKVKIKGSPLAKNKKLLMEANQKCQGEFGYFFYSERNKFGLEALSDIGLEGLFWDLRDRSLQMISLVKASEDEKRALIEKFEYIPR